MNILVLILSSFAIGVAVTAPIGPINLLVIRTSLKSGFSAGVWVGLGSVLGDGIFAAIAAFGLSALFSFFEGFAFWLQLAAGVLMLGYGVFVLLFERKYQARAQPPEKIIGRFTPIIATLVLTLTNPATMLGFVGLFGALSGIADYTSSQTHALITVLGVMAGSLSWICALSAIISWLHKNLSDTTMENINRGTAIALIIFGLVVLLRLFLV